MFGNIFLSTGSSIVTIGIIHFTFSVTTLKTSTAMFIIIVVIIIIIITTICCSLIIITISTCTTNMCSR